MLYFKKHSLVLNHLNSFREFCLKRANPNIWLETNLQNTIINEETWRWLLDEEVHVFNRKSNLLILWFLDPSSMTWIQNRFSTEFCMIWVFVYFFITIDNMFSYMLWSQILVKNAVLIFEIQKLLEKYKFLSILVNFYFLDNRHSFERGLNSILLT